MELVIQDSETKKIYDISEIAQDISYNSERQNGASKLTFSYLNTGIFFSNGSIVRFKYNGANIFYGYIREGEVDEKGLIKVNAYDQLRYLKAKDTKMLKGYTADKLIKEVISDFKLRSGAIENTSYVLENKILEAKTLLDMIYDCLSETLIHTKRKYIFYDNFGEVTVRESESLKLPIVLGDEGVTYGYSYSRSIDGETYNKIKLAQDNKTTGIRENYVVQDSDSMSKWGILQYYEKVDEKLNPAQIKERAEQLLKLYNSEEKKFSLKALGDVRVRGGSGILVQISDLKINNWFMVESVNHDFSKGIHTMDMELVII